MYQEFTKLQREIMQKYKLDALVTMSPENITYLTGTSVPTQITVRQREVAHILTMDCDPEVIIVNSILHNVSNGSISKASPFCFSTSLPYLFFSKILNSFLNSSLLSPIATKCPLILCSILCSFPSCVNEPSCLL